MSLKNKCIAVRKKFLSNDSNYLLTLFKVKNYPLAVIKMGTYFTPIAANPNVALSVFALPIVSFVAFGLD